ERAMLSRGRDIARASLANPAHLMVFDLLAFEGHDARGLPLFERKQLLRRLIADCGVMRYIDHIEERGAAMFASVEALGLEGVVAKRADSPYRAGRSEDWLKIRSCRVDDFAVVGWTPPGGSSRVGFGGLHLAARDGERWVYAGKVGSGFKDAELDASHRQLDASPRATCECDAPGLRGSTWVEPSLVACVRYKEWRPGRLLRQPIFLRLRDDKTPEECAVPARSAGDEREAPDPAEAPAGDGGASPSGAAAAPPAAERTVAFSNLDKVFWPAEGYTKGDLIAYHREVAPWLLPYLADRPLVLTRYPDGIEGQSFYQKDAPEWAPPWVRTESVWSEHSQREIHYFVCDDLDSLLYVVNLGTIPLHVWSSGVSDLGRPDWCILDLDPKGAPFSDVVDRALTSRRLCDDIELDCFVKTSGSTGLHVLLPLGRQVTYEQSRQLAGLIVQLVEAERPDIATTAR